PKWTLCVPLSGRGSENVKSVNLDVAIQRRCADLQMQFTDTVSTMADQKELIAKLEHDLGTIQSLSAVHRPDAEGAAIQNLERIPEPIKEATALFYGTALCPKRQKANLAWTCSEGDGNEHFTHPSILAP
ncbi:hypothetical protein lerEdw1_004789, partial [Lerista edwardsae]